VIRQGGAPAGPKSASGSRGNDPDEAASQLGGSLAPPYGIPEDTHMPARDIIVVGASAGGVESLCRLVQGLPAGLPATLFVVCHFPPAGRSVLPEILSRQGPLLVTHAQDGETFHPGQVYVAPPDAHLLLERDAIRLSRGARENRFRPAIDPLFRSAARQFGPRVVGVLLSGALTDGVAGLLAVRSSGGVGVIQDPSDALVPSLPENAFRVAGADYVVPVRDVPALLVRLVQEPLPASGSDPMKDPIERAVEIVNQDMQTQVEDGKPGSLTIFTCPECGGSLWQLPEKGLVGFRCHVGHAYDGETLLAEKSESLEAALWTALRTFKEKSVLARQLVNQQRGAGNERAADRFEEEASLAEHYATLIQTHLLEGLTWPRTNAPRPAKGA
jgi:two-component system chemotaxis response regulator CheB